MKIKFILFILLINTVSTVNPCLTSAQLVNSSLTENSDRMIEGIRTTVSESLIIGPNAKISVNGTWHIYSKYVWIHPDAELTGNGTIVIHNSTDAGGAGGATVFDANSNTITIDIVHNNAQGMSISNVHLPQSLDTLLDWNPIAPLSSKDIWHSSSLTIGKEFDFATNGAHVFLNDSVSAGLPNHSQGNFIIDTNAQLTNYGANRMIVTNNSTFSSVEKLYNASQDTMFFFPIGISAGDYTPATLFGTGGSFKVGVTNYSSNDAPSILVPQEGMDRIWYVNNATNNIDSIIFQHNSAVTDGIYYTDMQGYVIQYDVATNTWIKSSEIHYIVSGVHGTSSFTGTDLVFTKASDPITPLPVTWLSFNAEKEGNMSLLDWSTINEKNNKGFNVEHSADGMRWKTIGFVQSLAQNGNSGNQELNYRFIDKIPVIGANFYRLQQVDFDGSVEYSHIAKLVHNKQDKTITIHPNPTNNGNVSLTGLTGNETILIYDLSGKVISIQNATTVNKQMIDVSQLSEGIYNISVVNNGEKFWSAKLVKVN